MLLRDVQRIAANARLYSASASADRVEAANAHATALESHLQRFLKRYALPHISFGAVAASRSARGVDPAAPSAELHRSSPAALRVFVLDIDARHGYGTHELIAQQAAQRGLVAEEVALLSPYVAELPQFSESAVPAATGGGDAVLGTFDAVAFERGLLASYDLPGGHATWSLPLPSEAGSGAPQRRPATDRGSQLYYRSGPALDVCGSFVRPTAWSALGPDDTARLAAAQGTQWTPVHAVALPPAPTGGGGAAAIPTSGRTALPAKEVLVGAGSRCCARNGAPVVQMPALHARRPHQTVLDAALNSVFAVLPPAAAVAAVGGTDATTRPPPRAQVMFASIHEFVPGDDCGSGFGTQTLSNSGVYLGDASACRYVLSEGSSGPMPTSKTGTSDELHGMAEVPLTPAVAARNRVFPAGFFAPHGREAPFLATLALPLPAVVVERGVHGLRTGEVPNAHAAWKRASRELLLAAAEFEPDVVIVSLGLNSLKSDCGGGLGILPSDLRALFESLGVALPASRFIVTLEGGEGKRVGPATANSVYDDLTAAVLDIQVSLALVTYIHFPLTHRACSARPLPTNVAIAGEVGAPACQCCGRNQESLGR